MTFGMKVCAKVLQGLGQAFIISGVLLLIMMKAPAWSALGLILGGAMLWSAILLERLAKEEEDDISR